MRRLFFRFLIIGIMSLWAGNVYSQTDVKDRRQQQNADIEAMRNKFDSYLNNAQKNYDAYKQEAQKKYEDYLKKSQEAFDNYVRQIKSKWGGDSIVDNTQKVWVEYSDDFSSRSVVDFEQGTVTIEVLIDEKEAANKQKVDEELAKAVDRTLSSCATTNPYRGTADETKPLTQTPVLDGLVDISGIEKKSSVPSDNNSGGVSVATPQQRKEVTKKVVQNTPRQTATVQGDDGKKRTEIKVQVPMVSDHLSRNAARYKNMVLKYSQKFNIEPALIFAVIEQESAFDPQATSWVPAFGLMQLVPTSGGKDAYRRVTGKDEIPQRDYLFDPDNNIHLGTAYLRILFNQFEGVTDINCRRLCVIAAYNTGAGNVNRALSGTTKFSPSVYKANQFSYSSLYSFLTTNLQHAEARNYVKKVTEKREKYLK